MTSIIRRMAVVAMIFLTALVGIPATAQADEIGSTQLGSWITDVVTIKTTGSGLYVGTATASFKAPLGRPCNTRLYITFFDTNNVKYNQLVSPLTSGCVTEKYFTKTYNTTMRAGRVCAAVSINGVMKPGACAALTR